MKFDVEFNINRFPLNLQHRAVELAAKHKLGDVLFPSDKGIGHTALPNLRFALVCAHSHTSVYRQLQHIHTCVRNFLLDDVNNLGTQTKCN